MLHDDRVNIDWPFNDFFFMRRCVAIWRQRGPYATVTWEWPDGLACPEYSKSVELLQDIVQAQNIEALNIRNAIFLFASLVPSIFVLCMLVRCKPRRSKGLP